MGIQTFYLFFYFNMCDLNVCGIHCKCVKSQWRLFSASLLWSALCESDCSLTMFTDVSGRTSKANYCLWSRRWSSGRHLSTIAKWPFCLTLLATHCLARVCGTVPLTLACRREYLPHWHAGVCTLPHWQCARHASKWNLDSANPHLPL